MRKFFIVLLIIFFTALLVLLSLFDWNTMTYIKPAEAKMLDYIEVSAYVTGYNTVEIQTDSTPCIGASGKNICDRRDTIACPRAIELGTVVEIDSMFYVCEDRLSLKYDHRWDINCDKDLVCPGKVTGLKVIKIYE